MAEKRDNQSLMPARRTESAILTGCGQRVLLDRDLAALYGVETRVLNRRSRARFPSDFMHAIRSLMVEKKKPGREVHIDGQAVRR